MLLESKRGATCHEKAQPLGGGQVRQMPLRYAGRRHLRTPAAASLKWMLRQGQYLPPQLLNQDHSTRSTGHGPAAAPPCQLTFLPFLPNMAAKPGAEGGRYRHLQGRFNARLRCGHPSAGCSALAPTSCSTSKGSVGTPFDSTSHPAPPSTSNTSSSIRTLMPRKAPNLVRCVDEAHKRSMPSQQCK